MAGCSSGIRLYQFTTLKNDIFIMGSIKDSSFMFLKNQDFENTGKIGYLVYQNNCKSRFLVKSSLNPEGNSTSSVRVDTVLKENDTYSVRKDVSLLDVDNDGDEERDLADENGRDGKHPGGGSGGGGSGEGGDKGDNGEGDEEEEEFGPLLKFENMMREAEARGDTLPADMIEATKSGLSWLGAAMRSCAMLRNRMLADPSFLFKVGTEYSVLDSIWTVGAMIGVAMTGKLADLFSRRGAMDFSELFCLMGWLAIIFGKNALWLDIGRLLMGYEVGIISYVVPVYIGEITPKNLRGAFTTVN